MPLTETCRSTLTPSRMPQASALRLHGSPSTKAPSQHATAMQAREPPRQLSSTLVDTLLASTFDTPSSKHLRHTRQHRRPSSTHIIGSLPRHTRQPFRKQRRKSPRQPSPTHSSTPSSTAPSKPSLHLRPPSSILFHLPHRLQPRATTHFYTLMHLLHALLYELNGSHSVSGPSSPCPSTAPSPHPPSRTRAHLHTHVPRRPCRIGPLRRLRWARSRVRVGDWASACLVSL